MRRGFTLTEVIVVLGLVALLTALMVPTLKGIQAESRSAACMSHLRQLHVAIESYRSSNRDLLPICEFLPVVVGETTEGGLPELLKGYCSKHSTLWCCPADHDEEGSLSTGTSYLYLPGLLRYTPQIQIAVQQAMIPYYLDFTMSQKMKDKLRTDAEARLTTRFYEHNADRFAVLVDSQDRHVYGDRNPKNALYLDGGVRILKIEEEDDEAFD